MLKKDLYLVYWLVIIKSMLIFTLVKIKLLIACKKKNKKK